MRLSQVLLVLGLIGAMFHLAAVEPADDVEHLSEITDSDEFRFSHAEVLRLYFAFFDRAPDLAGAMYWVEVNNQGHDVLEIAGFFQQSIEFEATYGQPDDAGFLEVVYDNVLGRAPDAAGLDYWLGLLKSGQLSRAGVMVYFAAGAEFADSHRFPSEPTSLSPFTFGPSDGPVTRFFVHAEEGSGLDEQLVVLEVQAILSDYRSWITSEEVRFRRVGELGDADVEILIATPATVDVRCAPLKTNGRLSCRNGRSLIINVDRWNMATSSWSDTISEYRAYVINHEMGHLLGKGHVSCPGVGQLAPVMQQQTKGLNGCKPNGWPNPQ